MVIQNTPTKIDKIASLRIGQRGENLATDIKMDVSDWITVHPDANYYCLFKRPDEVQVQPVLSSLEEDVLTWTVRAWECAVIGVGYLEVRAVNPDTGLVAKSRVIPCAIEDSVIDDEGPVPPEMTWVGEVLTAKDTAVAAKTAAEEARDTAQTTVNGAIAGIQAEGQTQIGAVQSEGTTQVGNVNAAGTTQVGAVQAKGTEVLNSIPSDYTALTGEVSGLKSAVNDNYNDLLDAKNKIESVAIAKVIGRATLKAGTSLPISTKVVEIDVPANHALGVLITTTATITGNIYIFVYKKSDDSAVNLGAITLGTMRELILEYDVSAVAFSISGTGITAAGTLTATATVLYDNPNAMDFYVDSVKRSRIVQTKPSENLFTWWEVGSIYTNGKIKYGEDHIISAGYIPVESGETYTINDPDKISAGARNAQYVFEYDNSFNFIKRTTLTNAEVITVSNTTKYIRLMSQAVGSNNYIIGDVETFKTFVYKGSAYRSYVSPVPIAINIGTESLSYPMAKGVESDNLFKGGAFLCGGMDYSTGAVSGGSTIVVTDFIPAQGNIWWKVFNGKTGDAQYLFEFDTTKTCLGYKVLSGKAGSLTLNANTAYIRVRSQTASASYALPDIGWYDNHFVVSNKPIIRYQSQYPVVDQHNVSREFYDTAVDFGDLEYIKTAADEYCDAIEVGAYDVVVPIITDVHSEIVEPYDLHNYIASKGIADVAFNLGDNIPDHYSTRAKAIEVLKSCFHSEYYNPRKCEVYVLCGNHDYNPANNNAVEYTINQGLYYSISQARTKKGYADSGKNYGYIDLDAAKVRLIWLDSGDIFDNATGQPLTTGTNTIVQQEQFTWFCNIALDFMDKPDRSEWAVVTLSHDTLSSLSDGGFAAVIKAFMDGIAASGIAYCVGRGTTIPQEYNVDFTEQGGMEYICHLNGHYHEDNTFELGNTGRMQIYIPCDNLVAYHYVNGERTAYTRTPNTIEEHCIDTFCLDKKNRTIYMKRLGVGNDRTFTY